MNDYLCNQYLSPLTLSVRILHKRGVLDTTLCDKVCQWLATGRWFSLVLWFPPPIKLTATSDASEILLKVAFNTITLALYLCQICSSLTYCKAWCLFYFSIYKDHSPGADSGITFANWMAFAFPLSIIILILSWIWLQLLFLRSLWVYNIYKLLKAVVNTINQDKMNIQT
jgi:hypothetical protein